MAGALGIDPDAVVGKLLRVWAWFDQHSENGNAPSVTKVTLDRQVGNAGFCDAMVSVGWMVEAGGQVSLPNFDRHNGETAKKRALTSQRVAKHKAKGNAAGNAQSVTASVKTALPREEKIREEKDQEHSPSDLSPSGAGDAQGQVVRMADRDGIPYTEYTELFNEVCGELFPQVAKLTDKRKKRIRSLWKTDTKNPKDKLRTDSLGYWRRYFEHCCAVEFFTKERNGTDHGTWRPDFDFLTSEKCYIGVLEGKYV